MGELSYGQNHVSESVAIYALTGAIVLLPVLAFPTPALVDYANHLARMAILASDGRDTVLSSNYAVHWRLLPNLAMDLIVPSLARLMPLEAAGRVFVVLTMCLPVAGTMALHRAVFGRVALWPACSFLFVYNAGLYWGFLNYLFASGVAMLAFAGWIQTRSHQGYIRTIVFAGIACALLVLHLFGMALYALCLVCSEFARIPAKERWTPRGLRRIATIGLQLAPAFLLWLLSLDNTGPSFTQFGGIAIKVYGALSPFVFGQALVLPDVLLIASTAAFAVLAIRLRWLTIATEMKLPLLGLSAIALLMPESLSGSWLANIRVPVLLPFFLIAGSRPRIPQKAWRRFFASAATAILLLKATSVSLAFADYNRLLVEFRVADTVIDRGSRLLAVQSPMLTDSEFRIPGTPTWIAFRQPALFHNMAAFAVIDRASFLPYLFTSWSTVDPTPRNAGLFWTQGEPISPQQLAEGRTADENAGAVPNGLGKRLYWNNWPAHFDSVLWIGDPRMAQHIDALQEAAHGSFFTIYRVAPR